MTVRTVEGRGVGVTEEGELWRYLERDQESVLEKVLKKIRYYQVIEGPGEGKKEAEVVKVEPKEVKRTVEEALEGESRRKRG